MRATITTTRRAKKTSATIVDNGPFEHCKLSPVTKKNYELALRLFREAAGIKNNDAIVKMDPKVLKRKLVDHILDLKKTGLSYSRQNMVISATQKLCELNDIGDGINWTNIRNVTSDNDAIKNGGSDKPYTKKEIARLIESANIRMKALILLMLSSGIRIGAVPGLQLRDLQKMDTDKYGGIYRIQVYSDSKRDRYITFTTPECAAAIDAYLQARRVKGERLQPDSALFRREFNRKYANSSEAIKNGSVTKAGLFKLIAELAMNADVRKRGREGEYVARRGYTPPRHRTPATHSFRKLCNTALVKSGVKPLVVELLLGHNIALQANYLRLTDEELAQEYIKAIDDLTISQEKQLQEQVDELQTKVADFDTMKRAYLELKQEKEQDEGHIWHLQEELQQDRKERQEFKQRHDEQMRQLAEAIRESQQAAAELRETMEEKLREREKREKKNRGRG